MDLEKLTAYALENTEITNESNRLELVKSRLNDYLV